MSTSNPDLVHALRGGIVESCHRGALAIVDGDGRLMASLGDIDRPIFPRSACKVLQALPLVASGAAEAFGLDEAELTEATTESVEDFFRTQHRLPANVEELDRYMDGVDEFAPASLAAA